MLDISNINGKEEDLDTCLHTFITHPKSQLKLLKYYYKTLILKTNHNGSCNKSKDKNVKENKIHVAKIHTHTYLLFFLLLKKTIIFIYKND